VRVDLANVVCPGMSAGYSRFILGAPFQYLFNLASFVSLTVLVGADKFLISKARKKKMFG
jgi:hypothetical protein